MSFIDTDDPFSIAAKRIRSSVIRSTPEPQLPIQGKQQPTTYIIEPDLMESQTGKMNLPNDVAFDDAGFAYNTVTGNPVQIVRRPNVLPIAKTPDGFTPVMPKVLDIVGNVMSPLAAGRVPVKAGEVVLGSGAVRTMPEIKYPLAKPAERWTNTTGQNDHLLQTMTPDEFLNKSRPLKIDDESRETIDGLKKHIEEGKPLDPLELHSNGKEDGRHRATAAKELGITEVPVLNFRKPEPTGPFYSALERTVDNAKIGKADANQWLGYLKNQPGVKQEELQYVLGNLPEGQISKQALSDIIKNNKIELKEVAKGGSSGTKEKAFELAKEHGWKSWDDIDADTQAKYMRRAAVEGGATPTKYHNYQLPGGENYQEMLLTTPVKLSPKTKEGLELTKRMNEGEFNSLNDSERKVLFKKRDDLLREGKIEEGEPYKSSHWDEPNTLAHVRYNDRNIPDVGKSLHLEEIQSDWHQAGRKQGYKNQSDVSKETEALTNARIERERAFRDFKSAIKEDKPEEEIQRLQTIFNTKKAETDAIQKRIDAINSGVPDAPFKKNWDELAFKRMLHKAANEGYDSVSWTPGEAQATRYDLSKQIDNLQFKPDSGELVGMKNGKGVIKRENITPDKLPDLIGKEASEKLLKTKQRDGVHVLIGDDLKIGGEGMKSFYDKMLVDKANALAKKYGAKVETKNISTQQGKILKKPDHSGFYISYPNGSSKTFTTLEEAQSALNGQSVHVLKLTPELRAKAKEGFPLFSSTPITTPVDYDPWKDDVRRSYTLVPVSHDPFK